MHMRRIGFIEDSLDATRFCDYLVSQRIHAKAEKEDDTNPRYAIWVNEEQRVAEAREMFDQFLSNPKDTRFNASKQADAVRKAEQEENARRQKNITKVNPGSGNSRADRIPVTIGAIALCVVIGLLTGFGNPSLRFDRVGREIPTLESRVYDALTFVNRHDRVRSKDPFVSIRNGEYWRVVTPAVLHGDMAHLAMNMMGLFFLGSVIERIHGGMWLLIMLVSIAFVASLVQVFWPESNNGGPNAVGSSGATYGLFGFFLLRQHFEPGYPISLPPMFLLLGLGFLVMGVLMVLPGMANGAHVGGLAAGMVFAGLVPTGARPRRRN